MNFPTKRFGKGRTVRREPGTMNRTERRFADLLDARIKAGEIIAYWFDALRLRLAGLTFYTPDFLILHTDGLIEVAEVKGGFLEDDAVVKFKVAAEMWWMFSFRMYQQKRVKDPFVVIKGK